MKKLSLGIFTLALLSGFGYNANAQVEQGNIIIDPYYGYPNFGKSTADALVTDGDVLDVTGIGPAGMRVEYLISDNFGVGVDFIYNSFGVAATYDSIDSLGNSATYTDNVDMRRIRVQLRMNYHFVQTDQMDAYVGFGAGTNFRKYTYSSTNPSFIASDDLTATPIPVSVRIALGARFYFTENIGINAELGLGGPVISGGLSIKF